MLSYHRETALQGALLVLTKSGRLKLGEYFTDIIALSSTTLTYIICLQSYIEFGEKTQNKGYYAVQGHRGRYQSKANIATS